MQPSHPDPYPSYRQLLSGPPLLFDDAAGLWIASRAAVIREVLENRHCHVRPAREPVPAAIAGSSAGDIFGALMRMNEGSAHACPRGIAAPALARIDLPAITVSTHQLAATLDVHGGAALTRWIFALPIHAVGSLLGVAPDQLPTLADDVGAFVRCLSPLSSEQQLLDASVAANKLQARIAALAPSCMGQLDVANLIGLLSQTHDATAGLIGNSVVALLRDAQLQTRLRADVGAASQLVRETARFDPPVHNTRRFVAQATSIAGVPVQAGDTIVLVLAAACRDPALFAQPDVFMLDRAPGPLPGFGHGHHACPGQTVALTIATAALAYLLALPAPLDPATLGWRYRPSTNGRMPEFFTITQEQP